LNAAVLWCELHCIREQIPKDLAQTVRVARKGTRRRVEQSLQTNLLGLGGGTYCLYQGAEKLA